MRKTLWSKHFTIITVGTVISAMGGVAMGFALFIAVSALPRMILPVLIVPYLDNFRRKPVIVFLDYGSSATLRESAMQT